MDSTPAGLQSMPSIPPIILPDLLPPDLLLILVEHLVAQEAYGTLGNLLQTSKTNHDLLLPILHQSRTLDTGDLTLDNILTLDSKYTTGISLVEHEVKARKEGWFFSRKGASLRRAIRFSHIKHLVIASLPPTHDKIPPTPIGIPLKSVETVIILPPVLHDLSLYFSAQISSSFLRPLAMSCSPSHLILRHPDDTALGSYKHLLNLLDELRWPSLRRLSIHNVGAHALPSRPGLDVRVHFAPGVPVKWDTGERVPLLRRMKKYERSRLTQLVMAIPRSVRVREGAQSLSPGGAEEGTGVGGKALVGNVGDGTRWTFVGAGRFFEGGKWVEESTGRLQSAVEEWAQREFESAGWSKEDVRILLDRIAFEC